MLSIAERPVPLVETLSSMSDKHLQHEDKQPTAHIAMIWNMQRSVVLMPLI